MRALPVVANPLQISVRLRFSQLQKIARRLFTLRLLVLTALLADCRLAFGQSASSGQIAGMRDFIEYWSATRLLLEGRNPYSPPDLFSLQQSVGWAGATPLIMWNPPWVMLFTLPLGLVDAITGQFLWLLVHVILVLLSARQLWGIYGGSAKPYWAPWILALSFVPTLFVLVIGQISPLILAGLSLFLCAERKRQSWSMGVALVMLSIKPHLLYLFWIVLALWIWHEGQWRALSWAALVGAAAALIPLEFDVNIYSHYLALYRTAGILRPMDWPVPTLRNVMGLLLHIDQTWIQFAPTMIGIVWALYYWQRHRHEWIWRERLPLVALVSIVTGFFVWTYDYVILLPALSEGAVWLRRSWVPWHGSWSARVYIAINAVHLVLRFWLSEELWYFWLAPALLVNYLVFRREKARIIPASLDARAANSAASDCSVRC